jgi:hypothetical protein
MFGIVTVLLFRLSGIGGRGYRDTTTYPNPLSERQFYNGSNTRAKSRTVFMYCIILGHDVRDNSNEVLEDALCHF